MMSIHQVVGMLLMLSRKVAIRGLIAIKTLMDAPTKTFDDGNQ